MIFNSYIFAFFFLAVFLLYWFVFNKNLKSQNLFLILVSYVFYGWWDWRFLLLLIFSTGLDFYTGLKIHQADTVRQRKVWLFISIFTNLGFLGFFKYFNFFVSSFASALTMIGFHANPTTLSIILPIGISFYTFHGLSYVLDIYYKRISPTTNFVDYSLFVCFFPLLVAGPIERATHLLPQVQKPRHFSNPIAADGLRQVLWGLFKKIVIADNCAPLVNDIFVNYDQYPGSILLLGGVLFAFQIYGDFSGYSDIALGLAKLLGFELLKNFSYPYFSRDIAEFWRRWHISLTTWFRDYIYIPMGGSRVSKSRAVFNTFMIFLISGVWHGANWTFIVWGILNAIYFIPLLLVNYHRTNVNIVAENRILPSIREVIQMCFTFFLVVIGWILFRAETIGHAFDYLRHMFTTSLFSVPQQFRSPIPWILLLVVVEWIQRTKDHGLQIEGVRYRSLRWGMYIFLVIVVLANYQQEQEFIYFQF